MAASASTAATPRLGVQQNRCVALMA